MLNTVIKYFLLTVIFIAIGYAWRFNQDWQAYDRGRCDAIKEFQQAKEAGYTFFFGEHKCIPRKDGATNIGGKI